MIDFAIFLYYIPIAMGYIAGVETWEYLEYKPPCGLRVKTVW